MEPNIKQWFRIADIIRRQLHLRRQERCRQLAGQMERIISCQEQLAKVRRGIVTACRHNWSAAFKKLTQRSAEIIDELTFQLQQLQPELKRSSSPPASIRQLYEELRQTEQEFGRLDYDSECQSLSVVTEPVELEGIELGEFEIRLQIARLTEPNPAHCLRIIARQPYPAAAHAGVTHPHVSDECLCPGDATAAVQAALAEGRLCDLFMLIHSVLKTYNPCSPYVALDEWQGTSCCECGYVINADDICYCEDCEEPFCPECIDFCRLCQANLCTQCRDICAVCAETTCRRCLQECSACGELLCEACIQDDLCPTCKEYQKDEKEDKDESNENSETDKHNENSAKDKYVPKSSKDELRATGAVPSLSPIPGEAV